MLKGPEVAKDVVHDGFAHAKLERDRGGSQRILDVVGTLHAHLTCWQKDVLDPIKAHDEAIVPHERRAGTTAVSGHVKRQGAKPPRQEALTDGHTPPVSVRHDCQVAHAKVLKQLLLCGSVGSHGLVPLQMVGCYVEQTGDARVKPLGRLELKARELGHNPAAGVPLRDCPNRGRAYVACGDSGTTSSPEELTGKGGRGRLSVGPGDGHPALRALAPRKLRLTHCLDRMRPCGLEEGRVLRNARRDDGKVVALLVLDLICT